MTIAEVLGLLIAVVVVATIADRLRIAYPILLVIAGLVVAVLPVAHRVTLQPDLILLVFLAPLIYDASLDTSARELRTHWRPIMLLAVGLVLATMTVVAVVMVTQRKVSQSVADEVRAALDVDETTMRP
ncbi:MAG TPA: cation:proton antiporter [Acidimicrobiales bacterium]